jgi:flagellar biosynthesis/type III secretory pathway chaperone
MTEPDIALSATQLCAVLAEENAALAQMDIPRATALVEAKRRATEQLMRAQRHGQLAPTPSNRALAAQLAELSQVNKSLLERAMVAQNRIMACIARALPKAQAQHTPYSARGTQAHTRNVRPVALFSRA